MVVVKVKESSLSGREISATKEPHSALYACLSSTVWEDVC